MVRAALSGRHRIGHGPKPLAAFVPAATVIAASLLISLPIISDTGWYPDFGYLALLSWRLLRSDPWPAWWAAPMGLVNDLFTGGNLGFSVALWCVTMLALDLIDRRTMWRDYWIEWGLAAVFLALDEWLQWRLAAAQDAGVPFLAVAPQIVISICVFPLSAWLVSRIDRWRLGR
jgi:rod shape-determining protein MreD